MFLRMIRPHPITESACELTLFPVKFRRSGILLNGTLFGLQFASVGRLTRTGEPEIARQKEQPGTPFRGGN
jgi:hypothetical protein